MNSTNIKKAGRREWIGLAVIALPCILYSMDLTVLNLAVPKLSADLKPSSSQLLWIVDIYGFLVAGLLIPMGTLGDRIGRRRLLLIGATAFGIASVLAAFSSSPEMLIATRAILGIAGATLAPSTLSLIRNMFHDPKQRSIAVGVWITSYSAGAAIGPLVGGIMLAHFWWGSVFLIGVPVMILLLVVGPILLPEYRDPNAGRMDFFSAFLSLVAILTVIYGLKHIAEDGANWLSLTSIIGGLMVGLLFIFRQKKLADPLIDIRLFRIPAFSVSLALYTLSTFVAFGFFLFIAQYLQLVLGMSPLKAGIWTMPFAIGFIVGSMLTPMIARRFRPIRVMAGGLMVAAIGFGIMTQIGNTTSPVMLVSAFTIYSLGLSPVFTLATDLILGTAPPERAGAASAISETGSEFGGALGIAILGSIGTAVYHNVMTHAIPNSISPEANETARNTLGGALSVAGQLPKKLGNEMIMSARDAYTQSFEITAFICAALVLITSVAAILILRGIDLNTDTREQTAQKTEDVCVDAL